MIPDPRWLEVLKASGWQTSAIAMACALFLLSAQSAWLPPVESWMVQAAAFGLFLFGCLALASFISVALKFFPVQTWVVHWVNTNRKKRAVRNYIPYMTEQEKAIISYLLYKNQKMFTAEDTGGFAATLISREIVVHALQRGQVFDLQNVPMTIPDHVWDVLMQCRNQFPYTPPKQGDTKGHPWRVPWMAR